MKVKCLRIYNEMKKEFIESSPFLTIGKEYVVLSILMHTGKDILFRLMDDESNAPALFKSTQFEVISGRIPSNWNVQQLSSGTIIFEPVVWQEKGFWELCFDGDPNAREIYKREARIIVKEED